MPEELAPPRKSVELEDPGAKELADSSDEHFSDASEGRAPRNEATSPIPITRVERVDDEPAHGEVPGTDAYKMRTQDAVPDEVEIVPEGSRSRSASRVSVSDRPLTPGGTPVPKTIVERVDDKPAHGEVPGTLAHQQRLADAEPDVIVKVPQPPKTAGLPTASLARSPPLNITSDASPALHDCRPESCNDTLGDDAPDVNTDEDGFGDFDEFEEGGDEDDFGDFDNEFQQGEHEAEITFDNPPQHQASIPAPSPGPPVLDFTNLACLDDITTITRPYINVIYPPAQDPQSLPTEVSETPRSIFLSERSHSLWAQLVAPPPLQPPDWVRSRIRRLFLVSLGVPVDLDEILPASKQKKLILPSIHISGERSPRPSSDGSRLARLKKEGDNASSTSLDSSASRADNRKRKGPPPPPELDTSSTAMLCATTDAALHNFTLQELQAHVAQLGELQQRAQAVYAYWQSRLESALGDKDAFEQVIESLVAHAKSLR